MSASDPMSPLERRYRGLLRLLPAGHRSARGEELLGLVLDLDEGRTRPSLRQAAGIVGLALRLRLTGAAPLLLTAFLIAYGTSEVATVYGVATGAVTLTLDSSFPVHNVILVLLIPIVLRLTVAVAWILGARRAALAVFAVLLAYSLVTGGISGLLRVDLLALLGLGTAVIRQWSVPRPRVVLLAAIPLAMVLWTVSAAWAILTVGGLLYVTAVVAVLGAVGDRLCPSSDHSDGSPAEG